MENQFYLRTGLAVSWVELPWHTYNIEYEKLLCEFAINCIEKMTGPELKEQIPENINKILYSYLNPKSSVPPPEPSGIGFKKKLMHRSMTESWISPVPGYFYFETENEERTNVYWFNDKIIRGSSLTVDGNEGKSDFVEDVLPKLPDNKEVIEYSDVNYRGWISIELTNDNGKDFIFLTGFKTIKNNLSHLTICFENESDKEWAINMRKSTRLQNID